MLEKHEKNEAEETREKKAGERWARWEKKRGEQAEERWTKREDRQRLERQGDEIVDMIRRHEEEEEEKRRQAEGMSAEDEYRMMVVMAREVSEHRVMFEEETQKGRKEAREKVVEMEEMIEKGYGNGTFGSERENWKRVRRKTDRRREIEYCRGIWRRQIGTKRKREFGEKVKTGTWRKKGRRISRLEKMSMCS